MKIAYLDCRSGVAGDMLLGALVDAGWSIARLRAALRRLPIGDYSLRREQVTRCGLRATRIVVRPGRGQPLRRRADIRRLLRRSGLGGEVRQRVLHVFDRLFEAEAAVHGIPPDRVRLHELGAVDCLVDIVGTVAGLHGLGVESVYASAVNTGGGEVLSAHGRLPVPAPAAAELLKGVPVFSDTDRHELATPTGAALLSGLAAGFGPMPEMRLERVGHGAGALDRPDRPNLVRLLIGEGEAPDPGDDAADVIETNIDDMDPRLYEHVMDRLLAEGAHDVFLTPILMKKSRPATRLSVIAPPAAVRRLAGIILTETTSFGVRVYGTDRRILERRTLRVETRYGRIRVKIGLLEGRIVRRTPEYEDCRRAAARSGTPLRRVIAAAARAAAKAKRNG